jgi:serine/threonine-protein kinase HipA
MTPLYDIVSVQPTYDAHEIKQRQMTLAMSIGNTAHCIVDTVVGRHFVETGKLCGLPQALVSDVIQEIGGSGPRQIDAALAEIPAGFPETIATSIATAAKTRIAALLRARP